MIARRNAWLEQAGFTLEDCGKHIFTWNVFRIDCDPEDALGLLATVEIQPLGDFEGANVKLPLGRDPFVFVFSNTKDGKRQYRATQPLDDQYVRREAAENALIVAEIMGEELTEEQAIAQANALVIDGTVTITLEAEPGGPVRRRTIVVEKTVTDAEGVTEISNYTQTVDRETIIGGEE